MPLVVADVAKETLASEAGMGLFVPNSLRLPQKPFATWTVLCALRCALPRQPFCLMKSCCPCLVCM